MAIAGAVDPDAFGAMRDLWKHRVPLHNVSTTEAGLWDQKLILENRS